MNLWAGLCGSCLGLVAASPMWLLLNGEEPQRDAKPLVKELRLSRLIGYHIRAGGRDLTVLDWK